MSQHEVEGTQTSSNFSGQLGLRLDEFSKAFGVSLRTVFRRIQDGHLNVVHVGRTPIITRDELVRLGLIKAQ